MIRGLWITFLGLVLSSLPLAAQTGHDFLEPAATVPIATHTAGQGSVPAAQTGTGPSTPATQPGIVLVPVTDISGSMVPFATTITEGERALCSRILQTGDVLLPITFAETTWILPEVHLADASQVANAADTISKFKFRRDDTVLFAGLEQAVARARQQGKGIRLVLIVVTDAIADLPARINRAEADRRLAAACAWWRLNPDAICFVVAPEHAGPRSHKAVTRLARLLNARPIPLESLALPGEIDARVAALRPYANAAGPKVPQPANPPRSAGGMYLTFVLLGAVVLGIYALIRRRRPPVATPPVEIVDVWNDQLQSFIPADDALDTEPTWRGTVCAQVTSGGATMPYSVRVPKNAPHGTIHFGSTGEILLPGLDTPITFRPDNGYGELLVPEDVTITLDGVAHRGGTFRVPQAFSFGWKTSFITVNLSYDLAPFAERERTVGSPPKTFGRRV